MDFEKKIFLPLILIIFVFGNLSPVKAQEGFTEVGILNYRKDKQGNKLDVATAMEAAALRSKEGIILLYLGNDAAKMEEFRKGLILSKKDFGFDRIAMAIAHSDHLFAKENNMDTESFLVFANGVVGVTEQLNAELYTSEILKLLVINIFQEFKQDLVTTD